MATEITMPPKDADRLKAMADTIKRKPESASEFLSYAYGLGYCQGSEVIAKTFLAEINSHSPTAASSRQPEEK